MWTVEYRYHYLKCADAVYQKLSKLVHACRNYSLPKLAYFFETQCICTLSGKNRRRFKWMWKTFTGKIHSNLL